MRDGNGDSINLWLAIIISALSNVVLAFLTNYTTSVYRDFAFGVLVVVLVYAVLYMRGTGPALLSKYRIWKWKRLVGQRHMWIEKLDSVTDLYRVFLSAQTIAKETLNYALGPPVSDAPNRNVPINTRVSAAYQGWINSRRLWDSTSDLILRFCRHIPIRFTEDFEAAVSTVHEEVKRSYELADNLRPIANEVVRKGAPIGYIEQWNLVADRSKELALELNSLTAMIEKEARPIRSAAKWSRIEPIDHIHG
jgi:hypothetical protein